MSYKLHSFDGLTLPTAIGSSGGLDLTPGGVDTDYVTLPGGRQWDALRTDRASIPRPSFTMTALLKASTAAALRGVYEDLAAKLGIVGSLIRRDEADTEHTIRARFTDLKARRQVGPSTIQQVQLTFQSVEYPWQGTTRTGATGTLTNSGHYPVTTGVLTFTAGGGAMTAVRVTGTAGEGGVVDWRWDGTLAAGHVLTVDCGAMTVKDNTANAYSGWSREGLNTCNAWLYLRPGANTLTLGYTGTAPTFGYSFKDGHA